MYSVSGARCSYNIFRSMSHLPPLGGFLFCRLSDDQSHTLQISAVFCSGGDDIDAGRFDTAVAKDIRQLGNVLFEAVENAGEQVPQVVWEDL